MKLFLLFIITLVYTSCGTLFTGPKAVNVMTTNNTRVNATLMTSKGPIDTQLPGVIILQKGSGDVAVVVKETDCIEPSNSIISKQFNVISVLNLTGVFSWTTDILTESIWTYDNAAYVNVMTKKECKK